MRFRRTTHQGNVSRWQGEAYVLREFIAWISPCSIHALRPDYPLTFEEIVDEQHKIEKIGYCKRTSPLAVFAGLALLATFDMIEIVEERPNIMAHLLADRATVLEFIAETPPDHVIELQSWKGRLQRIDEEIQQLTEEQK